MSRPPQWRLYRTTRLNFTFTIKKLDKQAPITRCKISKKKCAPWFNTICDALQTAKISRRKAEKRWRPLAVWLSTMTITNRRKKICNKIFNSATCSYYSKTIAESSNTKQFFSIANKLMIRNNLTLLPT